MDTMIRWFGDRRDGIGIGIALILLLVGGFQYFDFAVDSRIENGLDVLKRRENATFVEARTTLLMKWLENEDLLQQFSETEVYTSDLIEKATEAIFKDERYRTALANMANFYHNAAACTLDEICDAPVMCASLMGEIQDFLDVNKGYFIYASSVRYEDANTFILSMPEFVELCDDDLFLNVASRHDSSIGCRTGLYLYRFIGTSFGLSCKFKSTAYADEITREVEEMKKSLSTAG